jgi:hypothetical protein
LCDINSVPAVHSDDYQPFIFPNPVSGTSIVFVHNPKRLEEGHYIVSIRDVSGAEVYRTKILFDANSQSVSIDISALASGVYFVSLQNTDSLQEQYREKIIKTH